MPLSEHEQRILEEIERRLAEEDPRLVQSVKRASVTSHALRRVRWGLAGFALGFVLLFFFVVKTLFWVAVLGFALMLTSGLVVYHYVRRVGRQQGRPLGERRGELSPSGVLGRLLGRFGRFRGPR